MSEPEDITGLPAFARGMIDGIRQATKQKWFEAAATFFIRALINKDVVMACENAGFDEAAVFFRAKTVWLVAESLKCMAEVSELEASEARLR